ncbi:MAG: hypothetical protein M3P23_04870 [Actinomycetota bacterium]|nr:hypothetical protein [Actinomycetota bacterium]
MRTRLLFVPVAAAAALALGGVGLAPATAGVSQAALLSTNPVNYTPQLAADATVDHPAAYALAQAGSTMYVGGQFHAVTAGATTVLRDNIFAFGATTGALSTMFAPAVNGKVWAIRELSGSVYVAGDFTSVNGVARRGAAKLNAVTGAVDLAWKAPWKSGKATDMQIVAGRVIISGTFAGRLLALDPGTGADTGYIAIPITGTCVGNPVCGTGGSPMTNQPTDVYRFAISNDGTHLVGIGNFTAPHPRAFMLDLGATSATLNEWYYAPFAHTCQLPRVYPAYLRDVDFSPDGSYFVVVSTGYVVQNNKPALLGTDICDAAARFETNIAHQTKATWVNYTGGDTLHSVNITGAAVYVQGHNRWMDNAGGRDFCVPGCFEASPGIQALDPITGKAIRTWIVGKTRGVGGKDLLSTDLGLWVGSDGRQIGGETHLGIALLPVA